MELSQVPHIDGSNPSTSPDAAAMALTGNTMADLRSVAAEMGVSIDRDGNVVEATTQPAPVAAPAPVVPPVPAYVEPAPAQPQAVEQPATAPVEVPQKFQNADGTPNVEKIVKSTISAEEAIARYRAKERELGQVQNKANNQPQPGNPAPVAPVQLTSLEQQLANDLLNESAALGIQITEAEQRRAIAQARVMARGLEAKHSEDLRVTEDVRNRLNDYQRTLELKDMVESDPNLLSGEMVETLARVRQANPWLNNSPEPWKAAYIYHKGTQGHAPQVQTPNPTGLTARPPATPVGPVARVQRTVDVTNPKSMSDADLLAEIKKIHPHFRNI